VGPFFGYNRYTFLKATSSRTGSGNLFRGSSTESGRADSSRCGVLVNSFHKYYHTSTSVHAHSNASTNMAESDSSGRTSNGVNLNFAFPHFKTAADMYAHIREITKPAGDYTVRNFVGVIEEINPPSKAVVDTKLFCVGALDYYTKKNMGWAYDEEEAKKWQLNERGGEQGDYRSGMQEKIKNVIECLREVPQSKRAVITIPFSDEGSRNADWRNQGQTKCVRELQFYIEDGKLKCTGILRMQNANIFPKNIHFFAVLIDHIASELGLPVGEYTHWITNLCHDRDAINC